MPSPIYTLCMTIEPGSIDSTDIAALSANVLLLNATLQQLCESQDELFANLLDLTDTLGARFDRLEDRLDRLDSFGFRYEH
jgi:hypothetical protein